MSPANPAERRKFRRTKAPAFCRPVGVMFRAQSLEPLDLSWGGLRVYSQFRLRAGERMKMDLMLADGPTLSVVAEVVWVEMLAGDSPARCEAGLRFLVLDDAAKAAVASVLEPSGSEAPRP
jgi:hypothetical protein